MIDGYKNKASPKVRQNFGFMLRFAQSDIGRWGRWHTLLEDRNIGDTSPFIQDGEEMTECEKAFCELILSCTEMDQKILLIAMRRVSDYLQSSDNINCGNWVQFHGLGGDYYSDGNLLINTTTGMVAHKEYLREVGVAV